MYKSWIIFKKSVAVVSNNLAVAFRISGAIFVVAVFASAALNVFLTGDLTVGPTEIKTIKNDSGQDQLMALNFSSQKILALMGGNFIFFIAMSWIAIAWHRYILLEETSNQLFPSWNPSRIIWYSVKTLVMVFTIAFIIIIPFALVTTILNGVGLIVILPFINILLFMSFYYIFFRAGLILPAVALDAKMSIRQSFDATKHLSNEIWGLSTIVIAMVLFVGIVSGALAPNNFIGVLIISIFQWVVVMVSASLLTTLYGYAIERRPIK